MACRLLSHFNIAAPNITSYNDHNKRAKLPSLLDALAAGDVPLISDAGMPGISDPGHDLVVAAIDARHTVVPLPGASAVIAAVAASGMPSRRFHYLGFLPRQGGPRRSALREAATTGDTVVIFESPHRVVATLEDARDVLGDRRIAVCRELTKIHEEIWRGAIGAAITYFAHPRGEFVLVIEGQPTGEGPTPAETDIATAISELKDEGVPAKSGVAQIAQRFNLPRREAYRRWHTDDSA